MENNVNETKLIKKKYNFSHTKLMYISICTSMLVCFYICLYECEILFRTHQECAQHRQLPKQQQHQQKDTKMSNMRMRTTH